MGPVDIARARRHGQGGTTLVELLVVIVILAVIGGVTTTGIVASLRTQLDAQGVAETLDESRIATQRIRDVVRGASAICPGSTDTRLEVWTDAQAPGNPGVYEDEELTVFEITADDRLTRLDPGAGASVLISDEIINPGSVFSYNGEEPVDQVDMNCTDGETIAPGSVRTTAVTIQFEVENPNGGPNLVTDTTVQMRNAGLSGFGVSNPGTLNQAPTAVLTAPASCVVGLPCSFDGSGSTDPESEALTYSWDLDGDGDFDDSTAVSPTVTYSAPGDVTVRLRVVDPVSNSDNTSAVVTVVPAGANQPPVAAFNFRCLGAICDVDAATETWPNDSSNGAVSSDPNSDTLTYSWQGTAGPLSFSPTGPTAQFNFSGQSSALIQLTVNDGNGGTDTVSVTVSTTSTTNRINTLSASGGPKDGGSFTATVTINVTTTTGTAAPNQEVTFGVSGVGASANSITCVTNSGGTCSAGVTGNHNQAMTFTVNSIEPTGSGVGTYDDTQNLVQDTLSVTKNSTSSATAV